MYHVSWISQCYTNVILLLPQIPEEIIDLLKLDFTQYEDIHEYITAPDQSGSSEYRPI